MIRKKDIKKTMEMIGLSEDPEKYIESIETVLNLFNEIDKYEDRASDEPLYHPLDIELEPDEDQEIKTNEMTHLKLDEDNYVRGPPLRRR